MVSPDCQTSPHDTSAVDIDRLPGYVRGHAPRRGAQTILGAKARVMAARCPAPVGDHRHLSRQVELHAPPSPRQLTHHLPKGHTRCWMPPKTTGQSASI